MSDCEGQGHKAVVYKSHFPTTKAVHSHSVVTETPADTLANKRRPHTKTLFVLYAPTTGTTNFPYLIFLGNPPIFLPHFLGKPTNFSYLIFWEPPIFPTLFFWETRQFFLPYFLGKPTNFCYLFFFWETHKFFLPLFFGKLPIFPTSFFGKPTNFSYLFFGGKATYFSYLIFLGNPPIWLMKHLKKLHLMRFLAIISVII